MSQERAASCPCAGSTETVVITSTAQIASSAVVCRRIVMGPTYFQYSLGLGSGGLWVVGKAGVRGTEAFRGVPSLGPADTSVCAPLSLLRSQALHPPYSRSPR